jgi:hypothetical protein
MPDNFPLYVGRLVDHHLRPYRPSGHLAQAAFGQCGRILNHTVLGQQANAQVGLIPLNHEHVQHYCHFIRMTPWRKECVFECDSHVSVDRERLGMAFLTVAR